MKSFRGTRSQFRIQAKTKRIITGLVTAVFAVAIVFASVMMNMRGEDSFADEPVRYDGSCTVIMIDSITDEEVYNVAWPRDSYGTCNGVEWWWLDVAPRHNGYNVVGLAYSPDGEIVFPAGKEHIPLNSDATFYILYEAATYYLSFEVGTGTGAPERQTCQGSACDAVVIPEKRPTMPNNRFIGWADTNGALEASYQPGDTIALTSNKTLYAVWEKHFTLTWVDTVTGEESIWSCAPRNNSCEWITPVFGRQHDGYVYIGASTTANGSIDYPPRTERWVIYGSTTLYYRYRRLPEYSITFSGAGTNKPENQKCVLATTSSTTCIVTIPDDIPTNNPFIFYGWAESSGSHVLAYSPGDEVTLSANKTLYSIWIPKYTLYYDLNYRSSISGELDSCYPDDPDGTCEVQIVDEEPPRRNYDFLGWAESSDINVVTYYPGDTVTLSSSQTIYAVWKKQPSGGGDEHGDLEGCNNDAKTIEEAICLQDMNNLVKYSMEPGTEYELVDARDNIVYRIAKLADNNVWLLDNLQIGGDEEMLLTYDDTNTNPNVNNGEFTLPASGNWADSYTEPYIDTTDADVMLGNDEDKVQGGYYNYCAASAGTYCDESDDGEGDAEYDICPANWRMPTGGNSGEYQVVTGLYSDPINVLHLPLSGRFYGGSSGQIDQNGYFWSSTNRDGMRMYYLNRANQTVNPTGSYRRDRGYSMRCVAKDVMPEISCNVGAKNIDEAVCLQDVNAMVKESMEEEKTYVLFDSRDFKVYRVAKLADDKIWMQDNLRLGGGEPMLLTNDNTNTDPNINNGEFTLPASGDWVDSYTEPAIDTTDAETMLGSDADKIQGGYYNYCAASAGSYCDGADDGEGDVEYDICPAGWRMPTGGDGGEYQEINSLYSDLINVLSLPLSGRFYSGSSGQIDQNGYFWSSTNRDGMRMYYLNRSGQTINPTGSYRRDRGYSVRCVMGDIVEEGSADYWWEDDVNEHALEDESGLVFVVELSLRALAGVKVDGVDLAGSSYGLAGNGKTGIALYAGYLNTLAVGKHTLTVIYASGQTVESEFVIDEPIVVPDTGINSKDDSYGARNNLIAFAVGIAMMFMSGAVLIKRK